MEPPVFHVTYRSWNALDRDCRQQIQMQGLFLKTAAQLEQFSAVAIRLTVPDGDVFELTGEVLQQVPGQGMAVQFGAGTSGTIERLRAKCAGNPPADEASDDDPEVRGPGDEPAADIPASIQDTENTQRQIDEMTVAQKRTAALHGRKTMRMLLIRDRNKTIHPFVVKNPAITLDEIEQIAKMPSVNPDVLRSIAKSKEWSRSATVCRNLVRNPKTPLREALLLMNKLPLNELRALAKSSNVRTPIQQAARKIVIN